MARDIQFQEIQGLFAAANEVPEELEGAPPITYYKFYELDSAIPIVIGYTQNLDVKIEDCKGEDGLIPVVAQRLTRDKETGEWQWATTSHDTLIKTLEFGDAVNVSDFRDSVQTFIERREQQPATDPSKTPS